jgi:hypothetical protein
LYRASQAPVLSKLNLEASKRRIVNQIAGLKQRALPFVRSPMTTLIALAACLLAAPPEPAWSAPVNGLVGRVEFERKGEKEGTPKLIPYLVLKNVTDTIGTVDIYLDHGNLDLKLVDAKGTEIKGANSGVNGRNGFVARPFWLQLPYDSTIRMNASIEGYFTPGKGELLIEADSGLLFVPKGYTGAVFATGTFTVDKTPVEARNFIWKGKLVLPRVKLYDGKPAISTQSNSVVAK